MPMTNQGYNKLLEECGELVQVVAKRLTYPEGEHPDGGGDLNIRISKEMGDVIASILYCLGANESLDPDVVCAQTETKLARFRKWGQEENEHQ